MLNAELVTQKIQLHRLKKNITIYRFYNNIQRPIKREREIKRERQREVKGEYNDSGGEREQESERDTKSRVVERTRESSKNQTSNRVLKLCIYKVLKELNGGVNLQPGPSSTVHGYVFTLS